MATQSQAHANIVSKITPYSQDYNDWTFTMTPLGELLNSSPKHCLCGHRANHLFSYQYNNMHILLGKSCMKKHFKIDVVAKNAINVAEVKPARYCIVCAKHMRKGVHKIGDTHYTCYIKTKLLPSTRASISKYTEQLKTLGEGIAKHELTTAINILGLLEQALMCKISSRKNPVSWKYNDHAVLNDFTQKKITEDSQNISNQDLDDIEKDIQLMNNGKPPLHSKYLYCLQKEVENEALENEALENIRIEREASEYTLRYGKYAGHTLEDMVKDKIKINYLIWLYGNTKSEHLKSNIILISKITDKRNATT
jgi:hypothetical protein